MMPSFRRRGLNRRLGAAVASAAFAAALCLAGCLGSDPKSPVVVEPAPEPVDPLRVADSLYHVGSYAQAMTAYEAAIASDSNLSSAYYGYAKATMGFYEVDGAGFEQEFQKISAGGDLSTLLDHPDSVLTRRIQASLKITAMLGILADRDTLTKWYRYLDSGSVADDPAFNTRKAFMNGYLAQGSLGTPGYRPRARFPLTDGKVTYQEVLHDYALFRMMRTLLGLYDLPPTGVFDAQDRILRGLFSSDSLGNLGGLADSLKLDTVGQAEVNAKILELQNGLGDLSQILKLFTPSDSARENGAIDSLISSLGNSTSFYQFGDHLDNDGDGCIDEEIIDSLDNDLDGFVDEDARLINGNGGSTGPADGIDNDRNGKQDAADAGENKFGGTTASKDLLTFVTLSGFGSNWVKIKKDSPQMDIRYRVQADSLAVHLVPGQRPVPAQYAAKLDSAKTFVGGCWRNY